jgi:hypothetical protein
MDDKKRSEIHKRAVLEFLYASAVRAVAHATLAMVELNGDYEGADRVLESSLSRLAFAEEVKVKLAKVPGEPTIQSATVGQLADAAKGAAAKVAMDADEVFKGARKPRVVVVDVGMAPAVPDAAPGSNDFGAN